MNLKEIEICIDAGHYGKYNQSPADKTYFESERMWDLHLLQKKYLEKRGVKVKTTREDQKKDLDLKLRGLASKGCQLFVSNHTNSTEACTTNKDVDFVAIYYLYNDTTTDVDETSKELAKRLAPAVSKLMGVKQDYIITSKKSSNDRNGDGIMNDNYYGVLNGARQAETAGIIIEHSFHTNPNTVAWLKNDDNLDALAKLEADIIADFLEEKFCKEEKKPVEYYRVQVGAYTVKKNAENMEKKLKLFGYDCFVTKKDQYYRVQVGAYVLKENANRMAKELKEKGFSVYVCKS